jgi:3-keto-disaccharide hydrolase
MRYPTMFVGCCLLAMAGLRAEAPWKPLFNGKNFDGWSTFLTRPDPSWDVPSVKRDANGKYLAVIGKNQDPLKVFNVETVDGRPAIHITGQGFGVMTTDEVFGNVHVRVQIKWGERKWGSKINAPRDCGLLYFVHGEPGFDHETWPRSIEFQIQEHDMGDLYALGTQITVNARRSTGAARPLYLYDPQGEPTLFVQRAPVGNRCVKLGDPEKPKGEWNTLDLICFNGDSIHVVNGVVVMRLHAAQRLDGPAPAPLTSGQISLQTEGAETYYRDVMVQPITEIPAEYLPPK